MNDKNDVVLKSEFSLKEDFPIASYEDWKKQVLTDLKGGDFDKKLISKTYEGILLNPIYTRKNIENLPHINEMPGSGSFSRGCRHEGYLTNDWLLAQEPVYADAEEFNTAVKKDVQKGQNAVVINLDSATKLGIDSDYAGKNLVGDTGLAISATRSFNRALSGIDITKYPLFIKCGFSSITMLMMLSAYAKQKNINLFDISGAVEADPLGFLISSGNLPCPAEKIFDEMKAAIEWTQKNAPAIKVINVEGTVYHNAGANAVQELAFAAASAVEYLNQMSNRGIDVKITAGKIRFGFGIGSNFFMEIAKLRAAKILWFNVLKTCGVSGSDFSMDINARTSFYNQTYLDPYSNMLRTTTEAFSAILGGIDSLHTNPFDESFSTPNDFSRRIARNTQIILKEESQLNRVVDPAGGSYYVEWLTNEIVNAAWKEFMEIEKAGGMLEASLKGMPQNSIEKTSLGRTSDIKKRKNVIVGTNMFVNPKEELVEKNNFDREEFYKKRSDFLQKYRTSGDDTKHKGIIEKLYKIPQSKSPDLIDIGAEAFAAGATLGEITSAMRASAGEQISTIPLVRSRASKIFEEIRFQTRLFTDRTGSKPKVFLANMGEIKEYKARADFSRAFFEVGGFDVIYPSGFSVIETASKAALESGAKIVVVCSTDEKYPELTGALVQSTKAENKNIQMILAGYPKDQLEAHKKNGIDDFIYLGCDAHAVISNLLKILIKNEQL